MRFLWTDAHYISMICYNYVIRCCIVAIWPQVKSTNKAQKTTYLVALSAVRHYGECSHLQVFWNQGMEKSGLEDGCPDIFVCRNSTYQTIPATHGQNRSTMNTQDLQDEELVTLAQEWRQRALRGDKNARGIAHELERAVRQRFGPAQDGAVRPLPETGRLAVFQQTQKRRWKPW